MELAGSRAAALGLRALALQPRIDFTDNHAVFERLGFIRVRGTAHPGCDRVTSCTCRKRVNPPGRG